ncbi:DUF362 domain-containing protein [Pendulispora rubella]|uniref:DUF362 domain-containing protein n=1 Tax=Pendulispora rubella TaxID=2741070 RepID=A0ABZ2LGS7_9BACT
MSAHPLCVFALGTALASSGCARCGASGSSATAEAHDAAVGVDAAPDLVSAASVHERDSLPLGDDGGGAKVAGAETIDVARWRARNRERLHAPAPVTVLEGGSPRELGERICQASVPVRSPDTPVLLKPNLGGFDWFKDPKKSGGDDGLRGRITDPEFVRGVIRCLRGRGHVNITVAEGWGATHADWERLIDVSGYKKMTDEEHVPLVAMDDDGVFDVQGTQPGKAIGLSGMEKTSVPTLMIPKLLAEHLDHGLFLSLPKAKAHRFAVFSLGIKGMQGTVMLSDKAPAFRQKWRMHRELNPWLDAKKRGTETREAYVAALEAFAERIADVLEVEAPDAVLAEGAPAMAGDGFQKLVPSAKNFAVGGVNPILVDRVGAQLLGYWDRSDLARELGGHRTSPLLEAAAKKFGVDLASPEVKGDGAALLGVARKAPFYAMAGFTLEEGVDDADTAKPDAGETKPEAHAVRGTPTIDGKLDDAIWKRAPEIAFDTDYSGASTGVTTHVRFAWSNEALYAAYRLESLEPNTDMSRPIEVEREGLHQENCVELFLAPDPKNPRRYAEIELGPHGHYFDILIWAEGERRKWDTKWSGNLRMGTSRDPATKSAIIEVAIAAPEIVAALSAGARLPLGLFRMEGKEKPRRYLAFSPARTKSPNFHVPEAFGTLVIDP